MFQVRKYGPFVALVFGFLVTIAWIAAISWVPLYLVTSMLPLTAAKITHIPAALPLFATGLGALSLLGWRRTRKQIA
jgi:hypothetical protein